MRRTSWTWKQAIARSQLPPTTRHVLLTIALFMNDMGEGAYPSVEQLVQATGLSKRAVIDHIRNAADAGFLQVSKHGFSGQRWKRSEYRALWPAETGDELPDEGGYSDAPPSGKVVTDVHHEVVTDVHQDKNTHLNTLNTVASDDATRPAGKPEDDGFEAVWKAFPKTGFPSKKKAKAAWKRLSGGEREKCSSGAAAYAEWHVAERKKRADTPALHLATFITQRRWENYQQDAKAEPRTVDWGKRLGYFARTGKWFPEEWGPEPGQPGCMVPDGLTAMSARKGRAAA